MSDVKRWMIAAAITAVVMLAAVGAFCLLSILLHGEVR